jgi:pterin-4a-carbinolamine dehydratase
MARLSDEEIDERLGRSEDGLTANDFELAAKIDSSA